MFRLVPVFVAAFFLSINFGALLYVNSTFLNTFFSTNTVSLIFLIGAVGNMILFLIAPRLLNWFRKEVMFFVFLAIIFITSLGEWFFTTPYLLALAAILYASVLSMAYYCIDIFIEEDSSDHNTGEIRGIYFTFFNSGLLIGPLLVTLLNDENLRLIYLAGAALLIMPMIIAIYFLITKKPHQKRTSVSFPIKEWWHKRNIRAITLCKLSLEIFFAIMVIYAPLYLHEVIKFSWYELGLIFFVMLLPFALLEWPAGKIADRYWGEKEMLSVGFFITGVSLLFMPYLGHNFWYWLWILLLSRIGASLVEIMTESYFFKKINEDDVGMLSVFRFVRPLGIVLGTVIAVVSLQIFSFEKIFFVLAVIIFWGMKEGLYLRDTR